MTLKAFIWLEDKKIDLFPQISRSSEFYLYYLVIFFTPKNVVAVSSHFATGFSGSEIIDENP